MKKISFLGTVAVIAISSFLSLLSATPLLAAPGDYTYSTPVDGKVTINAYNGAWTADTNLVIPSTIDGYTVVGIGDNVFSSKTELKSVVLPSTLLSIGNYTFFGTSLTSIIIPDSVTSIGLYAFNSNTFLNSVILGSSLNSIGESAFSYTALTSIAIPSSVTSISVDAFTYISPLTEIIVDGANLNYSSIDGVLFNKSGDTLISFPNAKSASYTVPNGVKNIGYYAFSGAALTSIVIPASVTNIGDYAFAETSLSSITIPSSVISVSAAAFPYSSLFTEIIVDEANPNYSSLDGVLFNKDKTTLVSFPISKLGPYTIPDGVTKIGIYAFSGTTLDSIIIPDSVTSIGDEAFSYNALTSIAIPDRVTSIGNSAFANCSSLSSVTLGSGVTSIGDYAFSSTALTSITIPDSVTSIGDEAFSYNALTSIAIPDRVTSIGNSAFANCSSLSSVTLGSGLISIGNSAFYSTALTSITISDSVTSIGSDVFSNTPLSSVTLGNSLLSIGDSAFSSLPLTSITIPNSVTSIGERAFFGDYSLSSVTLGSNLISIGNSAFEGTSFTSIIFPSGLTSIGERVFANGKLTSIIIPDSVTSIGNAAFNGNNNLVAAYFLGDAPDSFGTEVFNNTYSYFTIYYPSSAVNFTTPVWQVYTASPSTDIDSVISDKEALTADSIKGANADLLNIATSLALPATGANNSTITWSSNNSSVVPDDGKKINRPKLGDGNLDIILTATITKGLVVETKTFNLTVLESLPPTAWWTNSSAGNKGWKAVAVSADGTKMVAGVYSGYISISSDSGYTWAEQTSLGSKLWESITASSDGTKLAAVVDGGSIYTSSNGGANWTEQTSAGTRQWKTITSSADGTKLAAVVNGGYIYTSVDSGITWIEHTEKGTQYWGSITSSADGVQLAATVNGPGGYIYMSYDSGDTWEIPAGLDMQYWSSVTSSADGTKLATIGGSSIYTSVDNGATWVKNDSTTGKPWVSITSSSDGTKLVAVVTNGYVYTSSDSGVTWDEQTDNPGSRFWYSVASSGDGNKIAAASNSYVHIYGNLKPTLTNAVVTESSGLVTLNGYSNTANTSRGFEYGLTTKYGATTTEISSFSAGSFSVNLSSFLKNKIYHYRSYAVNGGGTGYSQDSSFILKPFVAQTESQQTSWMALASSYDGRKLAATDGYSVFTSSDSGATWTQNYVSDNSHALTTITSSSNGEKLAVADSEVNGHIYTSNDSGVTWDEQIIPAEEGRRHSWRSITSSDDGVKLAVAGVSYEGPYVRGNYIYTSDDSGKTWTSKTGTGAYVWYSIASSENGEKLAAVNTDGKIFTSADSGETWAMSQPTAMSDVWQLIISSADGSKLVAAMYDGYIFRSSDSGATWVKQIVLGSHKWKGLSASADGKKIFALDDSGYIYSSLDSGLTWTQQIGGDTIAWRSIVSSLNGRHLAVFGASSYIYTYSDPLSPTLTTGVAESITQNSSTLKGIVTTVGEDVVTTRGFEYGLTTDYTSSTTATGIFNAESFTANIASLACGTNYHYRAYAINSADTGYGDDSSFTTSDCSVASSGGGSSAPDIKKSTGSGTSDAFISMGATSNVGTVSNGGVNILGYINSQANFTTPESNNHWSQGSHSLSISNLDLNTNIITLTFSSKPQTLTLAKGEVKDVDLDGDGKNDIQVTFSDIVVNRAEITVKSLSSTTSPVIITTATSTNQVVTQETKLTTKINTSLIKKLAGRILLQVETKGQAWYLDIVSLKRYYLADGPTAYSALRKFGLGITNANLNKIPVAKTSSLPTDYIKSTTYSSSLTNKLKGRIVLQVENHGEAWYINPTDGMRYYLANGEAAYQIMRNLSLGITDLNIHGITVGEW